MTFYQKITPAHLPFDLGLDDQGRAQVAFNIDAIKKDSTTFIEEVVAVLTEAGVGLLGTTIFPSSSAELPIDSDTTPPFLTLHETGGSPPINTHNEIDPPAWPRPSAKLVAHAQTYVAARALARAAWRALAKVRNVDILP